MTGIQSAKLARIFQGHTEVCSDADLDAFATVDDDRTNAIASSPNPNQCGTLDRWVARLTRPGEIDS